VPITFRCSECTQKLRIEDDFAGKRVACVRCGSKQRVPLVSSPEFLQPAIAPRKSRPPAPPAPPPKAQESAEREPVRREPERKIVPPERPSWFKPIEPLKPVVPVKIEPPPPIEPEPVEVQQPEPEPFLPEPFLPEPYLPERLLPEPIRPVPTASEPTPPEPEQPAPTLVEQAEPEEVHDEVTAPVPERRRVAARAQVESSLVPPYKKLDVEEMIDMTAMGDIVFFLLIFFLVTSMHALDSTIPMPAPDPKKGAAREPQSVAAIDSDDSYVVVRIDRNDKILVEGSEVRSDRELLFKLRDLRLASAHPEKLLVVGHGDATHGTVVMVLDAGRELGMDQVRLTMQDEAE
jgi:biopolymer transport protein ExbD